MTQTPLRKTVTVLTHRRPEYLQETLRGLINCYGINDWRVVVVMDRPDRATAEVVSDMAVGWEKVSLLLENGNDDPYHRVSKATLMALSLGFAGSDFVAHLEEDCVPAKDYLEYMSAMAERHRDNQQVFTVSGWWGHLDQPPEDVLYEAALHQWFVPWGFGTWSDRFNEMRAGWSLEYWDRHLNESMRGDRLSAHPLVSRILDIGKDGGVNPVEEWQDRQDRAKPVFALDTQPGMWHPT